MTEGSNPTQRRLDHVDRRTQVGVGGAMRARDVSRPDDELVDELSELDRSTAQEAGPSPRTD